MLHPRRVVLNLYVGHSMRAAIAADQQAVALGIIATFFSFLMHAHQTAIGVLRLPSAYTFRDNPRFGIFAQMHHFGPGVGLLHVVGNRNGIKLALAFITAQHTGRVFPSHRRAGFNLCPHHLGPVTTTISAFGNKIINPAFAVFIAGIPILHRGIFNLCIFFNDDLDHRGVQLCHVALGRRTPLKIADITAFVGDDQRALKLARIFGIDPKIGRQLHWAAYAGWNINKRSVRKHRRIQRRIVIIRYRHDGAEIFAHQFGVLLDRL